MCSAWIRLHSAASVALFSAAFLGAALVLHAWLMPIAEGVFLSLCLVACPLAAWVLLKAWSVLVRVSCPHCGQALSFALIPDWRYHCTACGFRHDSESSTDTA